jgi:hypothetical protein
MIPEIQYANSMENEGMTENGVNGMNMEQSGLSETSTREPIAIVGFSLKFPQDATSSKAFWTMLLEGRSANTEIPKNRMNADAFYKHNGTGYDTVCK